jgi:hypothetical protein
MASEDSTDLFLAFTSAITDRWPFLLIVRTGRIFTVRETSSDEYRRILGVSSIQPAALPGSLPAGADPGTYRVVYLRTVIVTAAVYRGLGSELRPCGLTPPRNLPAPGRRHSVYIVFGLRTLLCF